MINNTHNINTKAATTRYVLEDLKHAVLIASLLANTALAVNWLLVVTA